VVSSCLVFLRETLWRNKKSEVTISIEMPISPAFMLSSWEETE